MKRVYTYESVLMALGDISIFIATLWISVFCASHIHVFGTPAEYMSQYRFFDHLTLYTPLILCWLFLFVIGGLYDRHMRYSLSHLPKKVVMVQCFNILIALAYVYILQALSIQNSLISFNGLLMYALLSSFTMVLWRIFIYKKIITASPTRVVCIGAPIDVQRFKDAEQQLRSAGIHVEVITDIQKGIDRLQSASSQTDTSHRDSRIDVIVTNSRDGAYQKISDLVYTLMQSGVVHMNHVDFYEEVFEMIPIEHLDNGWFFDYVCVARKHIYIALKRLMDIIIALPLAIASIVWYPIVYIAIKLEDGGPIFIFQQRVGEKGRMIRIVKFRSMTVSDAGKWVTKNDNRITRVGKIIRKTRIDELPQLINVLKGDLSLIGPRPELPTLVELYKKEIPHYDVRHMIQPGLSGWAQIHHDLPPHSIEETKVKVSYDLYYIKNRGIMLDLYIAFATIKTLLSRTGI